MDNRPNILKFPTRRQRRNAQRKLFSWYTVHEIFNVTVACLIARIIESLWVYFIGKF